MPSRINRAGREVFYYGGEWRSREQIEKMRGGPQASAERQARAQQRDAQRAMAVAAGIRAGKTWEQVASEVGVSRQRLYESVATAPNDAKNEVARAEKERDRAREAEARRINKGLAKGLSGAELAAAEGCTESDFYRRVEHLRREFPELVMGVREASVARRRRKAVEFAALYKQHGTYEKIARATGQSAMHVGRTYRQMRAEFPEVVPPPTRGRR